MLCTDRFSAGGHALVLRIQTGQWRCCAHTRSIEGRCAPEEISCPQQVEEGCSAFVIAPFLSVGLLMTCMRALILIGQSRLLHLSLLACVSQHSGRRTFGFLAAGRSPCELPARMHRFGTGTSGQHG